MGKKEAIFKPQFDYCSGRSANFHEQNLSIELLKYIPKNDLQGMDKQSSN